MELQDLLAWPEPSDIPGMLFRRLISKHSLIGIEAMTRAEQVLWLVFELGGELSSGGLAQFFTNSSGDRAHLVPEALQELGFPELASALAQTLKQFPPQADREERVAALARLSAPVKAQFAAVEKQLTAANDAVLLKLVEWISSRPTDFTLTNAGLCAFRPVEIPPTLPLAELFGPGVPNDVIVPALYVRWAGRTTPLASVERELQVAIHAFGEISDEGPLSYFFSTRGSNAVRAHEGLETVGASAAARVLEKALASFSWSADVKTRRSELKRLDADARAALAKLQWEMDELREPTLEALVSYARKNRASLR